METARPRGIQRIERTQERSVGSEEVHRQGIELLCCESMVAAVRRLLRRDGPRSASDDGRDAGGSWYPRGREDERLLGRTATRVRASDSDTSQCAVSARDLVTISVERSAPGGVTGGAGPL